MIIKICGVTTLVAARAAAECGADLVGFVFADSRRRLLPPDAKAISTAVKGVGKVGVFVNASLAAVREIAQMCALDYVQLHGDEPPEYCARVGYPVIKAVRVGEGGVPPGIGEYPVPWLLLDTDTRGAYGGTGRPFDWVRAAAVRSGMTARLMLAGGLTPENVGEAIQTVRPDGVDVSSGVEADGEKDPGKIARFIAAVRVAEREMGNA